MHKRLNPKQTAMALKREGRIAFGSGLWVALTLDRKHRKLGLGSKKVAEKR